MIRFLAFADNHIGIYEGSAIDEETGLNARLLDCLNVWDEIMEYAEAQGITLITFLGDRFRSTSPEGYIRDLADEKLQLMSSRFKLFICLVGNHDYYKKSSFYHSYGVAHIFPDMFKGLVLVDSPRMFHTDGINFWGLPFGYGLEELPLDKFNKSEYNVLLLHDEVKGVKYPSGHIVEHGLSMGKIEEFDLVLGGHIHLPQQVGNCKGGYIGSVTQLKRDDTGVRGWWDITIDPIKKTVDIKVIESKAPKYITREVVLEIGNEWEALLDDDSLKGNYLFLKGIGNKAVIESIDTEGIEQLLIDKCKLRFCRFERDIKRSHEFKVAELQKCKTIEDELNVILDKEDTTGLDKTDLRTIGDFIIKELQ